MISLTLMLLLTFKRPYIILIARYEPIFLCLKTVSDFPRFLFLLFRVNTPTTYEEVKEAMREASKGQLENVLGYTEDDCVSSDFNHTTYSCVFDAKAGIPHTSTFIKIVAW